MKFTKAYLLSRAEKTALSIDFSPSATVIRAGNGFGKSALVKSLYDTFGAQPHRIDETWRNGNVTSAVDFEIDGEPHTIVKFAGTYAVFGRSGRKEFQTTSVSDGLAPYFAELLDFRLLMTNQRQEVVVPPPAYAFAPFYVDQDKSWQVAWEPFRDMYLPRSSTALAEYHSGLKPNAYYVAKAEKDRLAIRLKEAMTRRMGLVDALDHLRQIGVSTQIHFDLDDFQAETASLLNECESLQKQQADHRAELADLIDNRALWAAQASVIQAALAESEEVFRGAVKYPSDVECPTCGEHYANDIRTRFEIAADTEALTAALLNAQSEERMLTRKIDNARASIDGIAAAIARVQAILSTQREGISLGEVVAAEGRNAATQVLRDKVQALSASIGELQAQMDEFSAEMRRSQDRGRSKKINEFFRSNLEAFSASLDVRVDDRRGSTIVSTPYVRGSEGPRGLVAYYYAFLHTVRSFGTSTFCPIVIDAPNQQGQDADHLPAIISFLVNRRPRDTQVILAVEELVGITDQDASVVDVGVAKRQLLREDHFDPVSDHLRPYLAQLVT